MGGESFTRRLLVPLDFETVSLLGNAGWCMERLMRLCVQSINGVTNAESAAGPTPRIAPEYEVFNRVIAAFEQLERENAVNVGRIDADPDNQDVESQLMWIEPAVKSRPYVRQFLEDLR